MGILRTYTTARDIIDDCCTVSSAVAEYIVAQHYLLEVSDKDAVDATCTDEFIQNKALQRVIDELKEMGIILNNTLPEFIAMAYPYDLIIELRHRFDGFNLYTGMGTWSDEVVTGLTNTLDELRTDENYTEAGLKVLTLLNLNFPLDDAWEFLLDNSDLFTTNLDFIIKLENCLTRLRDKGIKSHIDDSNLMTITTFIDKLNDHLTAVKQTVEKILMTTPGVDRRVLDAYLLTYNCDLVNPYNLEILTTNPVDSPEIDMISKEHHRTTCHHVEYYIARNMTQPTTIQQILLLSDLMHPGVDSGAYHKAYTAMLERSPFNEHAKLEIDAMAKRAQLIG